MLLIDGHASHISTAAIQYCIDQNIILLCLPAHTTYLLQPLDVGVFAPLANTYKRGVHSITRYSVRYHIDKVDFLELYQKARIEAILSTNIQKAWAKSGLHPFDPELVLQHFKPNLSDQSSSYNITIRPTTPPEATVTYSGPGGGFQVNLTPNNTAQIQQILQQAGKDGAEAALQKVGKCAIRAIAERNIQEVTNNELVEHNRRQENKKSRAKGNYGSAKVMNEDVINERKARNQEKQEKYKETLWKQALTEQGKISFDVFTMTTCKPPPTPRRPKPIATVVYTPPGSPPKSPVHSPDALADWVFATSKNPPYRMPTTTPSQPANQKPRKQGKKDSRLLVTLRIRLTTAELERGLRARQLREQQQQQQGTKDALQGDQSGRGMRLRKPTKVG